MKKTSIGLGKPLRGSGFTLIELLVAIAILAIVVAVAIPAYTNQVTRTNRAEGKALVMNTAQALERCYTRFSSYLATDGCTVSFPIESENGWYSITAASSNLTATTFSIAAVPQGAQATRDTQCGNFILNEQGRRDISSTPGDAGLIRECWR